MGQASGRALLLLLMGGAAWGQTVPATKPCGHVGESLCGPTASEVSPALVRQMRAQAVSGLTPEEARRILEEATARIAADQVLSGKILEVARRYQDLYALVAGLPLTVDAGKLAEINGRVKTIEGNDDARKKREDARDKLIEQIWFSSGGILFSALVGIAVAILQFKYLGPKRRAAMALELKQAAEARNAALISRVEATKTELTAETRAVAVAVQAIPEVRNAQDSRKFEDYNRGGGKA